MDLNGKEKSILSRRAEFVSHCEDFLNKYQDISNTDEYDEIKNPKGYVNMGTAVNNLCLDILLPKLSSKEVLQIDRSLIHYRECYGVSSLRKAFADLMTTFLQPHEPINPKNLFFSVGVTSSTDLLAHCIADPGEVFLAPTPIYPRSPSDFKQRSRVELWPIPLLTDETNPDEQVLTLEKVKRSYSEAISQKKTVRGVFIINPSNPMGDIYSPELLMEILLFCKEHELHVVFDEVYALSVFPGGTQFHSVLKFPTLPDPDRTHVLYGLSKDFAISGLRVGAIYTENDALRRSLMQLTYFQNIPYILMGVVTKFIEDLSWCKDYILTNQQRLGEMYKYCASRLEKTGIQIRKSEAAFFVWANFREVCGLNTFEKESNFFNYLFEKHHLYIMPGKEAWCTQPGWFRITFPVYSNQLEEGLNRLEEAIKSYKSHSSNGFHKDLKN